MEAYEAIKGRRTIRKFSEDKIPDEVLVRILEAGLAAPSNDHKRSWEFVVVDDMNLKQEIVAGIDNFDNVEGVLKEWQLSDEIQMGMYRQALPKQKSMLINSGRLIIPFFRQKRPLLEPRNLSSLNGFASIWCCVENILIAAAAEGIYGVTRIPYEDEMERIKRVINHPSDYIMPCYVSLGYPGAEDEKVEQIPVTAESKIHFNKW